MPNKSSTHTARIASGHIVWIDYAKSLAIFLVVWLHVHSLEDVTRAVNAFIMPLFFFLSGLLFSYERNPDYFSFVIKRFRQIIIPYIWLNIISWGMWLATYRYGDPAAATIPWYIPVKGGLLGIPSLMEHNIPLWSFVSFFVVEIIFYPLRKYCLQSITIAILFMITPCILTVINPDIGFMILPLAAGPSLAAIGFYALGHWIHEKGFDSEKCIKILATWPMLLLLATIYGLATWANPTIVRFFLCIYGCYPLYIISSLAGSLCTIGIAIRLARWFRQQHAIRFISVSTLMICGMHIPMFYVIERIAGFIGLSNNIITTGFIPGLLFAFTAFVLTLPLAFLIERHLPFLTDKPLNPYK